MICEHYNQASAQKNFLYALTAKTYWICLSDGCVNTKKHLSRQELYMLCMNLTAEHKVMLNCETLQIYCTECKKEISDASHDEQQPSFKLKKIKKRSPSFVRQMLVNVNETEDVLFAGNAEYPPSFQKQKQGLCGLKLHSLTSYLNSTIQLLAAIPIIADMCALLDPLRLESKFLKLLATTITTIWSGKYRIFSTEELEKQLQLQDSKFASYRYKTPQHLFYFIVKRLMEEFHYLQNPCQPGEIIETPFLEWRSLPQHRYYSFTKQVLGGECVFQSICGKCGKSQSKGNRFECLKISCDESQYPSQNAQTDIYKLIEESFNWRNIHRQSIRQVKAERLLCANCATPIKEYFAYVKLPNHLVIEFGDESEGLNTTLPNEIDLHCFAEDFVKKKSKAPVIYQYLGSIHRKNKRYYTHIRHEPSKKQYSVIDQILLEGERSGQQAKVAVYRRVSNPKNQPLYRNVSSAFKVGISLIVPLPDFWSLYLKHNHTVQPLLNPFICPHGHIRDGFVSSKLKEGPQKLPIEVYQYFLEIFGGRKLASDPQSHCEKCAIIHNNITQIKNSEKEMAAFADKLSHKKQRVLINRVWLESWKQFVYESPKKGYKAFGNTRPGLIKSIENDMQQKQNRPSQARYGQAQIHKPEEDLKIDTNKKISPQVWYFLSRFYNGKPLPKEIHPNAVLVTSVDLRLQNLKEILSDLYPQTTKEANKKEQPNEAPSDRGEAD